MKAYIVTRVAFMLLFGLGAVSASVLPVVEKRFELCVGVTGNYCVPGFIECCDSAGVCTVDQDGIPVRQLMQRDHDCKANL